MTVSHRCRFNYALHCINNETTKFWIKWPSKANFQTRWKIVKSLNRRIIDLYVSGENKSYLLKINKSRNFITFFTTGRAVFKQFT